MYKIRKKIMPPKKKQAMTLEYLLNEIMGTFHFLLRENPYENGMDRDEIAKRIQHKKELRSALKSCVFGDKKAKIYVKDHIKDILVRKYNIDRENIEEAIPFSKQDKLTAQDKFEILLHLYQRDYEYEALHHFIQDYNLDLPKFDQNGNGHYEISEEDIHTVYDNYPILTLNFNDKLNILSQRLYQNFKGNGTVDEIRDMKIDGVSGGVSGIPEGFQLEFSDSPEKLTKLPSAFDSIWIFYQGKSIHLSFLSFHSYKELIRICKNIYRYDNPGQLSEVKGYTVNEMKDGSRVSVARPPFCESWLFFVRKFDSVRKENIEQLLTDENNQLPIRFMRWLIEGCRVTAVTGEQGSGKTTLLMSLIQFINPTYNLRIQELSFELHLRKIYPYRNIVTFRETGTVTGQEGLDFAKKTDGTVNILGEVASQEVSAWLVEMAQVAGLFTLFTHHAKTTENLVTYMRNALLKKGGFHNERAATEQVVDAINFDIHMKKDLDGHRYVERITEIIPKGNKKGEFLGDLYETRDIIVFSHGKYEKKNRPDKKTIDILCGFLGKEEKGIFEKEMEYWE